MSWQIHWPECSNAWSVEKHPGKAMRIFCVCGERHEWVISDATSVVITVPKPMPDAYSGSGVTL